MNRMMQRGGLTALSMIAGFLFLSTPAAAQRQQINRPCRIDEYFVDVPTWASPSWSTSAAFAANLKSKLDPNILASWFCTGPGCPLATDLESVVTTVLTPRTATDQAWRNDGDRRFFRVGFRNKRTGRGMVPLNTAGCLVVRRIRTAANLSAGGTPLYVGRECDGSALGSPMELTPSQAMLDWPALSMNIPSGQVVSDGPTDLVLIDTGVDPNVAQASDVAIYQQQSFGPTGTLHPHGTAMALFLRQTAPNARLHDARALGNDGHSTSKPLATAIDWALFSVRRPNTPLVLNLSLGWHQSFSSYVPLSDGSCSTWEDPFGEPVHYLLTGAAKSQIAEVVAAAGNDPSTGFRLFPWTTTPPSGAAIPPACAELDSENRWFYPARWNVQSSCFSDLAPVYAATAVSGIDSRNRISNLGVTGYEAAIVAPGDHVYAKHGMAPARTNTLCDPTLEAPGPSLPRAFSGSSVSSAYAAGAIARAQVARIGQGRGGLPAGEAKKLLYLTGRSMCRDGYPVDAPIPRELDIGRLDAVLQQPTCISDLLACSGSSELILPTILDDCVNALATCGLEPHGSSVCKPLQEGVKWPSTYSESTCSHPWTASSVTEALCGSGTPCDTEQQFDKQQTGSVGPQPEGVGCPECRIVCGPAYATLEGQINKTYSAATTFTQPKLLVEVPGVGTKTIHLYGSGMPPPSYWFPGAFVSINLPLGSFLGASGCLGTKGNFAVKIAQPWPIPQVVDLSALRFQNY